MNSRGLWFRLRVAWRRNLWVLPALIVAGGIALGMVMVFLDPPIGGLRSLSPRLFAVTPDGAREVLATIATSMLGVAGVVFSITIATLSLTSQQFTSRVLRTFVRDRGNQAVLGVFLGVFSYCLVVLRTVRAPTDGPGYVPQAALLVAIALAIVGVGFLIYFIDHVASSIQASTIISRIATDTLRVLDAWPAPEQTPASLCVLYEKEGDLAVIRSRAAGYLRTVDLPALSDLAASNSWKVRMPVHQGRFVTPGDVLFVVAGANGGRADVADAAEDRARRTVWLASSRDIEGDPGFGVRQLVDIALKALSPGINDVTTALMCVDYLGTVLLAARGTPHRIPGPDRGDAPRVIADVDGFDELVDAAADQITENGKAQVAVLLRLLDVLEKLMTMGVEPTQSKLLLEKADAVERAARRGLTSPDERRAVGARALEVREAAGDRGGERGRAA